MLSAKENAMQCLHENFVNDDRNYVAMLCLPINS